MSDDQQRKEQLIERMCSQDDAVVRQAIKELRKRGWLKDGSLKGICLCDADLRGENLWGANLQDVKLSRANLQGANLRGSELEGTMLDGANLQGAALRSMYIGSATFSEHTILPDGTLWIRDVDMMRFTDPDHPDFWRSDDPLSPAYHQDGGRG